MKTQLPTLRSIVSGLTASQILSFRTEAHGDEAMIQICNQALNSHSVRTVATAKRKIARSIQDSMAAQG